MKTVIIKTDGNKVIASGHIRRCLSIAEALKEKQAAVAFWFSDMESPEIFKHFCAGEKAFSYTMEPPKEKAAFLLLDSYSIRRDEFPSYRDHAEKTGYIDDLCEFDPDVDLVINYDPKPPVSLYHAPVMLLGTEYAPLRKQFSASTYKVRPSANRIFISSGGTDPYRIIEKLLKELYSPNSFEAVSMLHCEVVIGAVFDEKYRSALQLLSARYRGVMLNEGVQDMAGLMSSCDLAITAGGTTLYELCAAGVPTIAFTMADNQLEFTESFGKSGVVCYEGDARKDTMLAHKLAVRAFSVLKNEKLRNSMSTGARSMVDGRGAERIADAIVRMIK
ncbi:MAG: UDP-2,4-diacetamido-2,4,6-trideoxy-beta-L-altropyranose hydrolase [Lachnospiraceae bacterium]|nr:UDP-2,4-diacetamido-2,4,6-trideoxy-beta-L-altropyranose hydrolase [Lachnospiraceae bacterium]